MAALSLREASRNLIVTWPAMFRRFRVFVIDVINNGCSPVSDGRDAVESVA